MRIWLTILLIIALLAAGGWVLLRLQSGQPLSPVVGYVPQLDSTQALILAGSVVGFFLALGGLVTSLIVAMVWGGRQVAMTQAQFARRGSQPKVMREPAARAAPQALAAPTGASPMAQRAIIAACLLFFAAMTALTIVKLIYPDFGVRTTASAPAASAATAPVQPAALPAAGASDLQTAFAALPPGDAARGEKEFTANPCASCHSLVADQKIVGPSLAGLATRAASGKPGYSAELYLYESITRPSAYLVEGFADGLMPQNFGQTLTPQQQADIIAFLMTQE